MTEPVGKYTNLSLLVMPKIVYPPSTSALKALRSPVMVRNETQRQKTEFKLPWRIGLVGQSENLRVELAQLIGNTRRVVRVLLLLLHQTVGGGVRIHPENSRRSGRHGVQYVAQCVACAALTLDVWQ